MDVEDVGQCCRQVVPPLFLFSLASLSLLGKRLAKRGAYLTFDINEKPFLLFSSLLHNKARDDSQITHDRKRMTDHPWWQRDLNIISEAWSAQALITPLLRPRGIFCLGFQRLIFTSFPFSCSPPHALINSKLLFGPVTKFEVSSTGHFFNYQIAVYYHLFILVDFSHSLPVGRD
ncbi:uncharacterized protein LY79DRAFT_7663 [Colletotrichum navitas]|uniref:Uncharacterized protein n=1 Tax=Colletotrichum navitas TaxID=681940 RepID=A0AAD8QD29_9PEZI|nr:uncharacterized protein LY79DRAFT_7663 [Colletotrichum navitas]KAK1600115.1 hypothetical protein LY79DRAFT_7663 [Colletotrichum navitas]